MRKIYMFMMLSLDGYFEGPGHDLSWHNVDDEFNEFALEQLEGVDLVLYGRRMYETMFPYWPDAERNPETKGENLEIAHAINTMPKIVFSRSLKKLEEMENWKNARLVNEFSAEEIRKLKRQPGKEIWIGGSELALSFIREGLIDEFRFMINPVTIGKGTKIFEGLGKKLNFKLVSSRTFKSGNVLLCYQPV